MGVWKCSMETHPMQGLRIGGKYARSPWISATRHGYALRSPGGRKITATSGSAFMLGPWVACRSTSCGCLPSSGGGLISRLARNRSRTLMAVRARSRWRSITTLMIVPGSRSGYQDMARTVAGSSATTSTSSSVIMSAVVRNASNTLMQHRQLLHVRCSSLAGLFLERLEPLPAELQVLVLEEPLTFPLVPDVQLNETAVQRMGPRTGSGRKPLRR